MSSAFSLARNVLAEVGAEVPEAQTPEDAPDLVGFELAVDRAGRFEKPTLFDDVILGRDGAEWPDVAAHVRAGGPLPKPDSAPSPSP